MSDADDAMEMLGAGYDHPAIEVEAPQRVIQRRNGRMEEIERAAFVKISTAFKPEMKDIDEIALKVWLYLALSVNRYSGKAHPGLRTIAEDCGMAVNTVRAAIERLEEKYHLLVVSRGDRKYNIYEPVAYVSANKTVSPDDTDRQTVSLSNKTVSAKSQTVSPRVILNQSNQSEPEKEKEEEKENPFKFYSNNIAQLTAYSSQELAILCEEYTDEWVIDAMKEAVNSNARNAKFIKTVLANWKAHYKGWKPETRKGYSARQPAQETDLSQKWSAAE